MAALNYKHLRYFWMVAKAGGVARAGERLHLSPQSISSQLRLLEDALGEALLRRAGRKLELTDAGRLVLGYADEIFTLGEELQAALRQRPAGRTAPLRVGVADVVPKSLAYRLLEPTMRLPEPLRVICREGRLGDLLADLALHRLDLVIADRPLPTTINVRGFSHLLGESGLAFFAAAGLAHSCAGAFPRCLDGLPLLLPGEDAAVRAPLTRWFDEQRLVPRIVGEFDDSALLNAFGQAGAGVFAAPSVLAAQIVAQYGVIELGRTAAVSEQFYAISVERRLSHPAVLAVTSGARRDIFGEGVAARAPQAAPRRRRKG